MKKNKKNKNVFMAPATLYLPAATYLVYFHVFFLQFFIFYLFILFIKISSLQIIAKTVIMSLK